MPAKRYAYDLSLWYVPKLGREHVWQDDAKCSGMEPELFMISQFGDQDVAHIPPNRADLLGQFNREKAAKAVKVCEGCPVRAACLENSETSDRYWTVRGGLEPTRLERKPSGGTAAVPAFPAKEYVAWSCKSCGSEKFVWHNAAGGRQRKCFSCSLASGRLEA